MNMMDQMGEWVDAALQDAYQKRLQLNGEIAMLEATKAKMNKVWEQAVVKSDPDQQSPEVQTQEATRISHTDRRACAATYYEDPR